MMELIMKAIQNKLKYGRLLGIPYRLWEKSASQRKEALRRWSNPEKKSTPVFLLGCGRSGTNMLSRSLGKSFQVELFNEDHPVAFERWRIRDFATIAELSASGYAQVKLYKPILDTHLARGYLSYFQNGKIIFIFRHFPDVINSSIKHFGRDNWLGRVTSWIENDFAEFAGAPLPPATRKYVEARWHKDLSAESANALYWLLYNRLYFDLDLDQNQNVMLVKYENVVARPDLELQKLCNFLEIKYSSNMIARIFSTSIKRSQSPLIEPSILSACDDLWRKLCQKVDGAPEVHNEAFHTTVVA
jgi:hypothetical protein